MAHVGWKAVKTERDGYFYDVTTATCIIQRRLVKLCRLKYLEEELGMQSSELIEIVWKAIMKLHETKSHLVTNLNKVSANQTL